MVLDHEGIHPDPHTPASLWLIALAALTPFPAAALIFTYGPTSASADALRVLLVWATVVLSFLGGVRWGLETSRAAPRASRLLGAVCSPVAGWLLYLGRHSLGASWVIAGFLGAFLLQWLFDHRAPNMPARYPRLSTTLTAGACVSLALALEQALHA